MSALFNPSRAEVRSFFVSAWARQREALPLSPLDAIAADWIAEHPEYHTLLEDPESDHAADYTPEQGQTNPFLHLAMHLSIAEQVSIDQPPGIRAATEALAARRGSLHAAHHEVMECLGTMLWEAQRNGAPPDGAAYVECVRRAAG
jgi:hypothetical protein